MAQVISRFTEIHEYFRSHRPPLLAVWGKNDPYFLPAGAEAFQRDLPDAEVRLFDTGHFALETHCQEIASAIGAFLEDRLDPSLSASELPAAFPQADAAGREGRMQSPPG